MAQLKRLLVVDDDREIGRLLVQLFERSEYEVDAVLSAEAARARLKIRAYDLVLLDVMMPGETGIVLCRQIRAQSGVPIIMLTAVSELTDRVVGLELGADDYITKPFEGRELLARVRAVLRRSTDGATETVKGTASLDFGVWRLDVRRRELRSAAGVMVPLSNAEFRVLRALAQRPNVVMSRDWLAEAALGASYAQDSRGIDVLISRLRSKLHPHEGERETIGTVRAGGYVLRP
jgi:two-component system OmpR family response regulator